MDNLIMLMLNIVLHFKLIYNLERYDYDNPNNHPNYIFTLLPYFL